MSKNIDIKLLLIFSLFGIIAVYSYFLTKIQIEEILTSEYLYFIPIPILFVITLFFRYKLKTQKITDYLNNINSVDLQSTLLFFLIFQGVDFYYEDGFVGMISQWVIYWAFGIIAWLVTININLYKNYQVYR